MSKKIEKLNPINPEPQSSEEGQIEPFHQVDDMLIWCLYDRLVDVNELVPHPANPNKHPDVQVALLQKILKEQGWRIPLVVSKQTGYIISGHGRLEAAKRNGYTRVPVSFQTFSDPELEIIHLIADNRIHELAHMDKSEIKDLLCEVDSGLHDLELTGFSNIEIESMMTATMPEFKQEPMDTEAGTSKSIRKCKHCGMEQ